MLTMGRAEVSVNDRGRHREVDHHQWRNRTEIAAKVEFRKSLTQLISLKERCDATGSYSGAVLR
jgi:hypothetical protein